MNFLDRFEAQIYPVFRIIAGFLFLCHGLQKILNFPAAPPRPLDELGYTAGAIQLVGGLLIMIGFYSRYAAFVCSGLMAVAYWMVFGTNHILPRMNGGELAVLYCFVYLTVAARGPGIWSINKH